MTILSETLTQILIPVAAVIGIVFALIQWITVSRISVSASSSTATKKYGRLLEEEEEGTADDKEIVTKCAEI